MVRVTEETVTLLRDNSGLWVPKASADTSPGSTEQPPPSCTSRGHLTERPHPVQLPKLWLQLEGHGDAEAMWGQGTGGSPSPTECQRASQVRLPSPQHPREPANELPAGPLPVIGVSRPVCYA